MQIYKGNRQGNIIPYTYPEGRYAVPYIDKYSQILANNNQVLSNIDHVFNKNIKNGPFFLKRACIIFERCSAEKNISGIWGYQNILK